jgi:predicted DNA-binding helix-hairpin-helix protein
MDPLTKLRFLGPAADIEAAEDIDMMGRRTTVSPAPEDLAHCVHHAATPYGRRIALLKTLLTSACERDCAYCPFRAGRDFHRATFTPDELAYTFYQIYLSGIAQGIFLSSSLAGGGPRTQDRLIATAEILRHHYKFRGYLHLKIMPGAEREQIAAALKLADRVSINLEAPNAQRLATLAPHKQFADELLQRLQWIQALRQEASTRQPSATTQFVVGAAGESDKELLDTTHYLYKNMGLARAYFSSFRPVSETPLEHMPPTSPHREHRLYQASFLLRDYSFEVDDMPFDAQGNLPLQEDPKLAWARRNLYEAPVELNTSSREMLLRVPGIGVKGAERILRARVQGTLHDLSDLRKLGIAAQRAAPFILLDGRPAPRQLSLW